MVDKIKEIHEELGSSGIRVDWLLFSSIDFDCHILKFEKGFACCEVKLSEWDIIHNTDNIKKIALQFFENYNIMFTTI